MHGAPAGVEVPGDDREAGADGVLQRRAAPAVADVDVRLPRGEEGHDGEVALAGGEVQRGPHVVVAAVRIHTKVQQLLHLDRVALRGEGAQLTRRICELQLSVVPLQQLRRSDETILQGVLHGRAPPTILQVRLSSRLQKGLEDLGHALGRGDVQRGAQVVVRDVGLDALLEEFLDDLDVARAGGVRERRVHRVLSRYQCLPHVLLQRQKGLVLVLGGLIGAHQIFASHVQQMRLRHVPDQHVVLVGVQLVQLVELRPGRRERHRLGACADAGRVEVGAAQDEGDAADHGVVLLAVCAHVSDQLFDLAAVLVGAAGERDRARVQEDEFPRDLTLEKDDLSWLQELRHEQDRQMHAILRGHAAAKECGIPLRDERQDLDFLQLLLDLVGELADDLQCLYLPVVGLLEAEVVHDCLAKRWRDLV
mmetsp:Transcript_112279/g.290068  ORF Transcript_112279/g.290068 Transcript_112279/m.290068 type:complete len:422 (+) Transcript_112279:844-2109(+)